MKFNGWIAIKTNKNQKSKKCWHTFKLCMCVMVLQCHICIFDPFVCVWRITLSYCIILFHFVPFHFNCHNAKSHSDSRDCSVYLQGRFIRNRCRQHVSVFETLLNFSRPNLFTMWFLNFFFLSPFLCRYRIHPALSVARSQCGYKRVKTLTANKSLHSLHVHTFIMNIVCVMCMFYIVSA